LPVVFGNFGGDKRKQNNDPISVLSSECKENQEIKLILDIMLKIIPVS
jgi:hypothetical protein